ncbi:MAG: XRE family transcriptional regulator [Cyclobacteriaceae bacterium]
MKTKTRHIILHQLEEKLKAFVAVEEVAVPTRGWIHSVRTSLNMTLSQLGKKLNITAQSVKELEGREAMGNITIKRLREAAAALDMKLVYGLAPKDGSVDKLITLRAHELSREIVMRASHSMKLEDQENTQKRLTKAIKEKALELKEEMPKYLWD